MINCTFDCFRCQWSPQAAATWYASATLRQETAQLQVNSGPYNTQLQRKCQSLSLWWNQPGKNGTEGNWLICKTWFSLTEEVKRKQTMFHSVSWVTCALFSKHVNWFVNKATLFFEKVFIWCRLFGVQILKLSNIWSKYQLLRQNNASFKFNQVKRNKSREVIPLINGSHFPW